MTKSAFKKTISGQGIFRNTIYSFLGQGIPLIVALGSMPILIRGLGTDRFGILTLIWMVISYFSLFDLGLGRAITQMVAERLVTEKQEEIPALVWTASLLMMLLGLIGTLAIIALTPILIFEVLKIPTELREEVQRTFYLLAFSIPIITTTSGFVGFLSALQRFDLINFVRIPVSIFMFLGPILVLQFSNSLIPVTGILVSSRVINWIINLWQCLYIMPTLKKKISFDKNQIPQMLMFGGWMTITNIIGPIMVYLDRFLIGSIISISAVAYYTTPYEVVTKLWIIPNSLLNVLFPVFATSYQNSRESSNKIFEKALTYIFFLLFPVILLTITFSTEGLSLWLGQDFSQRSSLVMKILAIGIFINSFANIAYTFIQGIGKPHITAKLHLIELPIYLLVVWQLAKIHGIEGVAIVWTARIAIDALLLMFFANQFLFFSQSIRFKMIVMTIFSTIVFVTSMNLEGNFAKTLFLCIVYIVMIIAGYNYLDIKQTYKRIFKLK